LTFLLATASGVAWGNDKLLSGVTIPNGQPVPIIKNNGVATGTIQLFYTATSCTVGTFAQFNLNLEDVAGSGTAPNYTVNVALSDDGKGTKAQVSPGTTPLSVKGVGWIAGTDLDGDGGTPATDADLVTISITSCDGIVDGSTAIANLEESTPNGSHLDTVTNVNVHINFVISGSCLNLYSFETDQDTGDLVNSVTVNAKKDGSVTGTSAPGQASVDVLVVNTCSTPQSFDLSVGLDPDWETNPHDNPGNATSVYTQSGELDPVTNFNEVTSLMGGTGTPEKEKLCLQSVMLPANSSYLVTVHSELNNSGLTVSALPSDLDFDFGGTIFQAGSTCTTTFPTPNIVNAFHENASGYIDTDDPSGVTTATSDLPFTVKQASH
jgi:hypothetical protein